MTTAQIQLPVVGGPCHGQRVTLPAAAGAPALVLLPARVRGRLGLRAHPVAARYALRDGRYDYAGLAAG